jgi:hypothetical protein
MDSNGALKGLFDRIRRKLHDRRPIYCALCGSVVRGHGGDTRRTIDGTPLCQSCFELVLKKAAQLPEQRSLAHDAPHNSDAHLA